MQNAYQHKCGMRVDVMPVIVNIVYNSPMAIRHGVCIRMLNTARHPAADAADDAAAIAF